MYYSIVKNGVIEKSGSLKDLFPNASFPLAGPNSQFIKENNLVEILSNIDHNSATHRLVVKEPYILDDKVYNVVAEKFTKAEVTANKKAFEDFEALQEGAK